MNAGNFLMTLEKFDAETKQIGEQFMIQTRANLRCFGNSLNDLLKRGETLPRHLVAASVIHLLMKLEECIQKEGMAVLKETLSSTLTKE